MSFTTYPSICIPRANNVKGYAVKTVFEQLFALVPLGGLTLFTKEDGGKCVVYLFT